MKVGYRKPSLKKSISARTTGRAKRALKKSINPYYGKKGTGWVRDPKKAAYNAVYHRTTKSVFDTSSSSKKGRPGSKGSSHSSVQQPFTTQKQHGAGYWKFTQVMSVVLTVLAVIIVVASPVMGALLLIFGIFMIYNARKHLRELQEKEALEAKQIAAEKELRRRRPIAIPDVDPAKIVCYDLETTGTHPDERDEILSLSIVDGNGSTLLNTLVKPEHRRKWDEAQAINGISPEMVRKEPKFPELADHIQDIFDQADLIIGYNILGFDNNFLAAKGIRIDPKKCWDVMLQYSERYMGWDNYHGGRRWAKLGEAAGK